MDNYEYSTSQKLSSKFPYIIAINSMQTFAFSISIRFCRYPNINQISERRSLMQYSAIHFFHYYVHDMLCNTAAERRKSIKTLWPKQPNNRKLIKG